MNHQMLVNICLLEDDLLTKCHTSLQIGVKSSFTQAWRWWTKSHAFVVLFCALGWALVLVLILIALCGTRILLPANFVRRLSGVLCTEDMNVKLNFQSEPTPQREYTPPGRLLL